MDNIVSQALTNTENSLVISQIFKIISSLKWDNKHKLAFIVSVFCALPKIFLVLLIKHSLKNIDPLVEKCLSFLYSIFYRREIFSSYKPNSFSAFMNNEIRKYASSQPLDSFLLKFEVNSQNSVVYQLRGIPSAPIYKILREKALIEFNNKKEGVANCSQLRYNAKKKMFMYHPITPNEMFPSEDFRNFKDIIMQTINCSVKLGSYQIIPLLLDGEPGLGKSKSLGYLAYGSKLSYIKRIDMTEFINHNLDIDTILGEVFYDSDITGHTLIMIDEIDKYIAGILTKGKKEDDIGKINQSILNSILSLIEHDTGKKYNLFVVFCSNNFSTIFDNVDMTHYASMQTRFIPIIFHRINKLEYGKYLQWLYDKLYNDDKFDENYRTVVNEYVHTLPDDFNITFRDLNQCTIKQLYNISKICQEIHNNHEMYSKPFVQHRRENNINIIQSKNPVISENKSKNPVISVKDKSKNPVISKNNSKTPVSVKNKSETWNTDIVVTTLDGYPNIPDILSDLQLDENAWKQFLNEDLQFENEEKFLDLTRYLITRGHLEKELIISKYSINKIILYGLFDLIILHYPQPQHITENIIKLLQFSANQKLFSNALALCVRNFQIENDLECARDFYKLFEIVCQHPDWINYIKLNDTGLVAILVSMINANTFAPDFLKKLLSLLEIPGDISLIEFYDKQKNSKLGKDIQNELESILNSKYFKCYCVTKLFYNKVMKLKSDDIYITSLIDKLVKEAKVSNISSYAS